MTSNIKKNRFKFVTDDEMYELDVDIIGANTPDITLGMILISGTNGNKFKRSGDEYEYGDLVLQIRLDEYMNNYQMFLDWMNNIHDPITGVHTDELAKQGSLIIYDINGKIRKEYLFWGIRPTNISSIDFQTNTDEDFEIFTVTLFFDRFELSKK